VATKTARVLLRPGQLGRSRKLGNQFAGYDYGNRTQALSAERVYDAVAQRRCTGGTT
jgi:hypothetical protein